MNRLLKDESASMQTLEQAAVLRCLKMKLGETLTLYSHRVQRVASGWYVDERFTWSEQGLADCLADPLPCRPQANTFDPSEEDTP